MTMPRTAQANVARAESQEARLATAPQVAIGVMFEVKGVKVAFVGVCTPETFTKSTPTYFQDANGNYIYGFCEGNNGADLYNAVQKAIDAAKAAGADYVIGLGHLGIDEQSSPWMSKEVIANTTGFTISFVTPGSIRTR